MSVGRGVKRSPPRQSPGLGTVPELESSASRNSINFSYPMNARPNSSTPPPSPPNPQQRPASVSLAQQVSPEPPRAPAPAPAQQQQQQQVASNPAKITRTRRHFSTGTVGTIQPSARTAVAAAQAAIVPSATGPHDQAPVPSRPVIVKRPSMVPEDLQGEVRAEATGRSLKNEYNNHTNANNNNVTTTTTTATRAVKQSPPVEQNRILPIRATVTPEPQIIRSPPTPEEINKQLSDHPPMIASPGSSRSVELGGGGPAKAYARQPTSSPGRSTRFSSQLSVAAGELQLHHPPPRSVSPVKSALKHTSQGSLSPDRIPGSIARPGPSSELSDGTSVASDDGARPGGIKRKPVKVSFDDEAEIVGVAASPPTSPEDMFPESPPGRSKPKVTWFGVGKKKPTPLDNADEFDEVLKPRRALPSFGSVRTAAARDGEIPEPVREEEQHTDNESVASSNSNHNMVVPGWSFANDHAIGGILANAQSEEAPKLRETIDHPPLPSPPPPQSVESPTTSADRANEYISELHPEWVDGVQASHFTAPPNPEPEATTVAPPPPATAADSNVAVQPSSDLEKGRSSLEGYDVPGGFPRTSMEIDPRTMPTGRSKRRSGDSTGVGLSGVDESCLPTANGKGSDDATDSDSVYSDAAEDFEGDGFGSINAIVGGETEHASRPGMAVDRTRPAAAREELPSVPEDQMIGRAVSPSLDSGLLWVPDSPGTVDEPLPFSSPYPPFPLKRKPTNPKPPPSSKVLQSNPSATPKAQRPVSVGGAPGRVSLGQGTATNGIIPRDSTTGTSALRQKTDPDRRRPASLGPVLANGNQSQNSPQRRPTTSDGVNRFTLPQNRSPGSPGPDGKGYSMRRSMRTASTQDPKVQFSSNRPTSPEDVRPTSSESGTGGMIMRSTLRGGPSKNGNGSKATTFFSTGKSPSKSPTRKKLSRAPGTLFSSRFDDSDDDDRYGADDRVRNFHSRFADSSDEEEPGANNNTSTLRPVRGIPRRQGKEDGESTELEDSSDDEARRARSGAAGTTGATTKRRPSSSNIIKTNAPTSGLAAVARSRGVSPEELEDFLYQQPSRKSGIFSRLNLRKPKGPEPKQLRKSTPETATAAAPKDPVLHHRGGGVTTSVTANGKANGKGHRWGSNIRHMARGEEGGEGEGWPLRSDRKPDGDAEAVAAETKTSAAINDGDEVAERSTPGGTTSVERGDSSVAPAGVAGTGAAAAAADPAAGRLAGEGSHFPRREEDNNKNTNSISARDVVISGSGRRKRFPKLRRAFGLR